MKNKSPTIFDLQAIKYSENGERLVNLKNSSFLCDYRRKDSGIESILVRRSVADKLQNVQRKLVRYNPKMQLLIVEGYRSFVYQEYYYLQQLLIEYKKNPALELNLILEHVHQLVALPSVAGHLTGGAIDLTIAYDGQEIAMGGSIADFSIPDLLPTYSNLASQEQLKNRVLLHDLMVAEGFAPFYGEWWHFSYGDREWAAFYNILETLYSPIFYNKRNPSFLDFS